MRRRRAARGSALTVVLIMAMVFGGVAAVASLLASKRSDYGQTVAAMTESTYSCEAVAELYRGELVNDFELSGKIARAWLAEVRDGTRFGIGTVKTYQGFPGVQTWINAVSPEDEPLWIDLAAGTVGGAPIQGMEVNTSYQTRVSFGNGKIFELAMLTDTANCMFCHLKVTGDIGAVGTLAPGWGAENSGSSSAVNGDAYIKGSAVMGTGSYAGTLNGATVTGEIHENYTGAKIPKDANTDGITDYPTVDPAEAIAEANGSVGVASSGVGTPAQMYIVPHGETYDPATHAVTPGSVRGPVIEGNLILVGTIDNPITLSQHVYVTGDVVVKGYVDGKGAVYAGRNAYVAGDIVYKTPPRVAGVGDDPDEFAREDVRNPAMDEFRLAARSNILIGNPTYRPGTDIAAGGFSTEMVPIKFRQTQDFITDQFGLASTTKYVVPFDSQTKHAAYEVTLINSKYYDDRGREVSSASVVSLSGTTQSAMNTRYDALVAPGQVLPGGSFQRWMTDQQYRAVLGTAAYDDYSWRMSAAMLANAAERTANLPGNISSTPVATQVVNDSNNRERAVQTWTDGRGPGTGLFYHKSGGSSTSGTIRVVENGQKQWETQVTHIDAFLFSNRRIAGKGVGGLRLNGGMISREIGLLFPGNDRNWWARVNADIGDVSWWTTNKPSSNMQRGPLNEDVNDFHLKYDFRLRNGGLGFDLISSVMGDRVFAHRGGKLEPPQD